MQQLRTLLYVFLLLGKIFGFINLAKRFRNLVNDFILFAYIVACFAAAILPTEKGQSLFYWPAINS